MAARLHGLGDVQRYNARMAAVEYAIEHDDGQSLRALDKADVILLAPSRCGKTPTTMYLALQHGVFVANYPLVPEDLDATDLPRPVRRCATAASGSPRRRPGYPGPQRAPAQLPVRVAGAVLLRAAPGRGPLPQRTGIPVINSSAKSVEEMSTVILQFLKRADEGDTMPDARPTARPTFAGSRIWAWRTWSRWAGRTPRSGR